MKKYLLVVCLMAASVSVVKAQGCSVCTKTAQGLDSKTAKGLNGGIIYLAFLPLGIMGALTFIYWKSNRSM